MSKRNNQLEAECTERRDRMTRRVKDRERSIAELVGEFDEKRLLAVVPAGANSAPFLNGSLPPLVRKTVDTGRGLDLLIGLNDDAPQPQVLDQLASQGAVVRHLWTTEKQERGKSAEIHDNPECNGDPVRISNEVCATRAVRIYVVHQKPSACSSGQNSMLLDLYGLLVHSVENGWKSPGYFLRFDAESHFLAEKVSPDASTDLETNGIREIIRSLDEDPGLALVCGRVRCTVFRMRQGNVSLPSFSEPIHAVYRMGNRMHGMSDIHVNTGPGCMGKTAVVLAAGYEGLCGYPSPRSEDILLQLLVKSSGYRHRVETACIITNNVPPQENKEAFLSQVARWIASGQDLRQYFRGYPRVRMSFWRGVRLLAVLLRHPSAWPDLCRSILGLVEVMKRVPAYRMIPPSGSPAKS